jgi:imidazolonepropionase-like amidohydrolase
MDGRDDLPQIVRAGRHLARTGRYIRNYGHEIEPDQLVSYVIAQARYGDGWVKLVGDWIDRDRGDLGPCWPRWAIDAAIAAAHAEGARVTAHVFGEDALPDLIDAGIDCIEHGTGLSDELIGRMAANGVALVPTMINTDNFLKYAAAGEEKFPSYAARMRSLHGRRHATVGTAHEAGVQVLAGTDAGGTLAHGLVGHEVQQLVAAGLPPAVALGAASWASREYLLGAPATLAHGDRADLVVLPDDPLLDPTAVLRPSAVVLRGRVVAGAAAAAAGRSRAAR